MHFVSTLSVLCLLNLGSMVTSNQHQEALRAYLDGVEKFDKQQYRQALIAFEQAIKSNPEWGQPYLELAQTIRLMGGRINIREEYLNNAQKQLPDNARVLFELALLARDKGDLITATEQLKKALEIRVEYHEARFELANILLDLQQNREALANLYPLREIYKDNSAYQLCVADAAHYLKQTAIEEEALIQFADLSGRSLQSLNRLRIFYRENNNPSALKKIEQEMSELRGHKRIMRELPRSKR